MHVCQRIDDTLLEFVTQSVENRANNRVLGAWVADGSTVAIGVFKEKQNARSRMSRLRGVQSGLADASEIVGGTVVVSNPYLLRREKSVGARFDNVESLGSTKRVKFVLRGSKKESGDSEERAGFTDVSKNSSNVNSDVVSEPNCRRKLTGVSKNSSNPAVSSVSKTAATERRWVSRRTIPTVS